MPNLQLERPLVSVTIPSYNRAAVLPCAVKSIFMQGIDSIEVIIADDGSTDNTKEVIKKLQQQHSNIIYIKNQKNGGEAAARNLAIKQVTGKYIAFLDSDDEWLPNKLIKQIDFLEKNIEFDAVTTNYLIVDSHGKQTKVESWFPRLEFNTLNLLKRGCDIGIGSTLLVKRSVFENTGYFDESLPIFVDVDWLCQFCENYFKLGKIEETLVLYNKAPFRTGEFMEDSVKKFKDKNHSLLKKYSLLNRALIESQFYNYISHSYLANGPFYKFFYTRTLYLLLNPAVSLGNHKHLLVTTFNHLIRKLK